MKKKPSLYFDGYRVIRKALRRIGADWENAKQVGVQLRKMKNENRRFTGPEIVDAWRAQSQEDWNEIAYWERDGFFFEFD